MAESESTEMLVDGLLVLGVRSEIAAAIVALCNSKEKQVTMMQYMADKIDRNTQTTEKELLNKAMEIAG